MKEKIELTSYVMLHLIYFHGIDLTQNIRLILYFVFLFSVAL